MPTAGVVRTIQEMALPTASPPGLISGAGSGCAQVRRSGASAEREKGGGEKREEGGERGGGLVPVLVSPVSGQGCHASVSSR